MIYFAGLVGSSPQMKGIYQKIELYGPADAPVIITGETGTGKELVARSLHQRSPRHPMPFVAVNCSALSEELFESELFGHERGSFTGAVKTHKGRFERAHRGTLFLDEIGDMPIRTQAKLLRVLEEEVIERVGGEEEYPVNVRVIAATNTSLEQAVTMHRFRVDLYHRLAVFRIHMPPLRERTGDIPLLVNHFLSLLNRRYNRQVTGLTPDALKVLGEYHWPGNVRELRNVLERVYVETGAAVIGRNAFNEWVQERDYFAAGEWNLYHLENQTATKPAIIIPNYPLNLRLPGPAGQNQQYSQAIALLPLNAEAQRQHPGDDRRGFSSKDPAAPAGSGYSALAGPGYSDPAGNQQNTPPIDIFYTPYPVAPSRPKEITAEAITEAFKSAGGNITQAARLLGIHKATLYRHMKELGLTRESLSLQTGENSSS